MGRFIAGVISALLFVSAGIFIWRGQVDSAAAIAAAPINEETAAMTLVDVNGPPTATEKTREQKRFGRYDKDKNGAIERDEYLTARRKAFAKLDVSGDGRLMFEEYAIKTTTKFAKADRDGSNKLTPAEFLSTLVARKSQPSRCPPPKPSLTRSPTPQADANSVANSDGDDDS